MKKETVKKIVLVLKVLLLIEIITIFVLLLINYLGGTL